MATQAMGWALFSVSLVCLCWLLVQVVAGVAYCIRCWALITGSVMFCAQLVSLCQAYLLLEGGTVIDEA